MVGQNKTVKFHGQEVHNILVRYFQKKKENPDIASLVEFDARNTHEDCQTLNVQVVSDFVTITFYKDESANIIIRRELVPTHCLEHIEIRDIETEYVS